MNTHSPWANFSYAELRCKCGHPDCQSTGREMDADFMGRIQAARKRLGFSLAVNSAHRCEHHPAEKTKDHPGTHRLGLAIDVGCSHQRAHLILQTLLDDDLFTGIGIAQKGGVSGRFIHVDAAPPAAHRPRPHLWSY